jgi:hypothetical protein
MATPMNKPKTPRGLVVVSGGSGPGEWRGPRVSLLGFLTVAGFCCSGIEKAARIA